MRLFAGVELDEPVRRAAAASAEELRRKVQRVAPALVARWIAPENLHITVWFIGEVPDQRAQAILEAFRDAPFRTCPFDLAPAGCGAFPPTGSPRVLWIGLHEGTASMAALYAEVGARLGPLGFAPGDRAYSAHLTIARVKDTGRAPARDIREAIASVPADCGTCRISALTLFRSRLSPRGAAYEPLLRVPLKG